MSDYTMYAWEWSHFAAKLRGYLNYKKINYREKQLNVYELAVVLPKHTGTAAMPAIKTAEGEWLADTPLIMEELERRHPARPLHAITPRQHIIELLIENWFDDGWMAVSGQTRWAYPENWEQLLRDKSAKALLPGFPLFLSRPLATRVFKSNMVRSLPAIGPRPGGQDKQLEGWALRILDILEHHFGVSPYLFGGHPTFGDFAILASLGGHLTHDPWPKREWMASRPNLVAWTEKLHAGHGDYEPLLANDAIPETLQPLIDLMLAEFPILLSETAEAISARIERHGLKSGDALPRVEREITYPKDGRDFKRHPFTYTLWRTQRIQNVYRQMNEEAQNSVDTLIREYHSTDFLKRDFGPSLHRDGLGTRLA